jgi:hypothetical protein
LEIDWDVIVDLADKEMERVKKDEPKALNVVDERAAS